MLAIYCRISQLKTEGKDRSIKEQRLLGIEKAKELNLPYKVFTEEGVSGTLPINKRPELEKIMSGIEDGLFTGLYIYLQDRLERNPEVRFYIKRILKENNAKLFTDDGEVNLDDDDADMLGDLQSIFNAQYVRKTKKRVKAVLKRNAQEGKAHGIMPYGYTKDKNGYIIIDDEESKIIERIYESSLKGIGTRTIAETLNSDNIPTRYNKISKGTITTTDHLSGVKRTTAKTDVKWSGNTIRNIINNPIYKGKRHFSNAVYDCPNIVTPTYWQKVNDNLKNNRNNSGKSVKHKYLLRGKLICGVCGRNYYGRTRVSKKDNFYMCSSKRYKDRKCGNRSMNIYTLEYFIWQRFFADEELKKIIKNNLANNDAEDSIKALNNDLSILNKKLITNKEEYRNAIRLAVQGLLDDADLLPEKERITKERNTLEVQIENLENEINNYQNYTENVLSDIDKLDKVKADASFNEKQKLIEDYIKKIVITEDKEAKIFVINIEFNIIDSDAEEYIIPIPKYEFAIEKCNGILIPLSAKAKNLSEEEKEHIVQDIYRSAGRTQVEFRLKEDHENCQTYYVWLSQDNWKEQFKEYCKKLNIDAEWISYGLPYSNNEADAGNVTKEQYEKFAKNWKQYNKNRKQ